MIKRTELRKELQRQLSTCLTPHAKVRIKKTGEVVIKNNVGIRFFDTFVHETDRDARAFAEQMEQQIRYLANPAPVKLQKVEVKKNRNRELVIAIVIKVFWQGGRILETFEHAPTLAMVHEGMHPDDVENTAENRAYHNGYDVGFADGLRLMEKALMLESTDEQTRAFIELEGQPAQEDLAAFRRGYVDGFGDGNEEYEDEYGKEA